MSNRPSAAVAINMYETGSQSVTSDSMAHHDGEFDAIVELARRAGMLVTLDGQIGREKYQSIAGSLVSFRHFVETLRSQFATQ